MANNQGHTALHKAAYKGHDTLCRWLIANTALGCSQDKEKVQQEPRGSDGSEEVVSGEQCECCIGYQRDAGGDTPAMNAREQRHGALAEWLQLKQDESASRCGTRQRVQHRLPVSETQATQMGGAGKKMQLTGPLGKLEEVVEQ